MRWDSLFADLEAQLSAESSDVAAEVAERSRTEWARTELADRLRAARGQRLQLLLRGGERLVGVCADAATQWVVLDVDRGQVLVPVAAVAAVGGLSRAVAPPPGQVLRRLGLGHALRVLARDRVPVRVLTTGGWLTGTLDRVGADHVDLAEHAPGEPRRSAAVRGVLTVPFAALCAVHSA